MQWWFIAIVVVAISFLIRIAFHLRYLILIRKQQKLRKLVADRTKEINQLNTKLEEKIKERTRDLNEKNTQLEEYAYINAHHLRGPLSKVMSIVHLLKHDSPDLGKEETTRILRESINEMDSVITGSIMCLKMINANRDYVIAN